MILVIFGGRVVVKFPEHKLTPGCVETLASTLMPKIPAGAALFHDKGDAVVELGTVTAIFPSKLERWLVKYEAAAEPAGMSEEVAAEAANFPSHSITQLRPVLSSRLYSLVVTRAPSVEALGEIPDAELLAVSGIADKSLSMIRAACAKVLE